MSGKALLSFLLVATSAAAMASEPGYRLRIESSTQDGQLTVVPQLAAPAGARLRYEIVSSRRGGAGTSNSSQSGSVSVGPEGSVKLSTLSVSTGPQDRYVVTVKVFDGAKLVAEEVLRHPQ